MHRHILLVEDNEDDRRGLSDVVLHLLQHNITMAADGQQAVMLANQVDFDLVLLDLSLPDMKGWDVACALRQMEHYYHVPIILITAYDEEHTHSRSLAMGCDRYLVKPVDVDFLVDVIGEYLPPAG